MKLNKSKCWILHLGWGNPGYMYKLGNDRLESNPMERDLRLWEDDMLNMRQQCALTAKMANDVPGCTRHSIASQLRDVIIPLYTALVQSQLKYCVQFLGTLIEEGDQPIRVCPDEGDQDGERSSGQDLRGVAEVTWLVQLGEEKVEE
ncbi:synapsin-2- hypothetical protein [Limosa lapponica baueri]|uniref:Uncharacterized protein n=1 Tax=Limosa lapponica baueri TaxID=1758121 RepID=A0A2I0UJ98_LIMLA|nr:synapsin-2- hypothetical protein [Limosa lapponica baueri]